MCLDGPTYVKSSKSTIAMWNRYVCCQWVGIGQDKYFLIMDKKSVHI